MAGPRTPRFDGTLRSCRFAGAVAPRGSDFCRSGLPTVMAYVKIPRLSDMRGRALQRSA